MVESLERFYAGKRVLITGGLGFLGSNLAIRLVQLGSKVTLLDGLLEGLGGNWFNIEPVRDKVEVVVANLADRQRVDPCVRGQDVVFNIAMQPSHLASMDNPLYDVQTNVLSQVHFLESLRAHNPEARVLYVGSRAQFGRVAVFPINEDTPPNPRDVYAVSKQAVEWYHFQYASICGLQVTSLRLGNTYGPRHQMRHAQYGVQNYLIRLAMEGKEITVYGDGHQVRELLYVEDAVEAMLRLARHDGCIGEVYCIGALERVSFLELVQSIIRAAGSGSYRHVPWPREREIIEVGDVRTDDSKLRGDTGWAPKVSLEQGLGQTVEFYRAHRERYW
jgi:UDP-glucose 4-epimerase